MFVKLKGKLMSNPKRSIDTTTRNKGELQLTDGSMYKPTMSHNLKNQKKNQRMNMWTNWWTRSLTKRQGILIIGQILIIGHNSMYQNKKQRMKHVNQLMNQKFNQQVRRTNNGS